MNDQELKDRLKAAQYKGALMAWKEYKENHGHFTCFEDWLEERIKPKDPLDGLYNSLVAFTLGKGSIPEKKDFKWIVGPYVSGNQKAIEVLNEVSEFVEKAYPTYPDFGMTNKIEIIKNRLEAE